MLFANMIEIKRRIARLLKNIKISKNNNIEINDRDTWMLY